VGVLPGRERHVVARFERRYLVVVAETPLASEHVQRLLVRGVPVGRPRLLPGREFVQSRAESLAVG
jgi:hypothetical protein